MEYVFLVRGYADGGFTIWMATLAMLVLVYLTSRLQKLAAHLLDGYVSRLWPHG